MFSLLILCLISGIIGSAEGNYARACEGNSVGMGTCGPGTEIDVTYASYGRHQGMYVCAPQGLVSNQNCHAPVSEAVARSRCQGVRSCTVQATNSVFGDPCHGTEKYFEVTYNCVPGSGLFGSVVQVCEGQSQNIQCAHPKRIKILSANYGRLPGGPSCGGPIATSHCGADYSLIEVKVDCQGASSCTLVASNSQFGDPCFGTRKYLEVRYRCE